MSTNLKQFDDNLVAAAEKINGKFEDFYYGVILETFRRIDRRTPVLTGLAQLNWQITFGSPATEILELSGGGDQSESVIEREAMKLSGIPPFSIVFITNNVEYISFLEYVRRSPQHPEGMVEITLSEMAKWLGDIGESE